MTLSIDGPRSDISSAGMGTLHAWESFGDGIAPDIQAVAKGLGGGLVGLSCIAEANANGVSQICYNRRSPDV